MSHRYWRIYITASALGGVSGDLAIGEIEMRESIGGSDVTGSGGEVASITDPTQLRYELTEV
jgi:hypothetical protein